MVTPGSSEKVLCNIRVSLVPFGELASKSSLGVTQRHDEGVGAMNNALDNELSEDGAVSSRLSGAANPPLCRRDGRGVDDKLVRALVECTGGLESGDVAPL